IFPLFLRRKTPDSHLVGVTPLFWYHRDVISRTVLVLPLFFDRKKEFESRTTGVLPFFVRHVNRVTETKAYIIPPALLYYRSAPALKDVVVFPLFWHVRRGEKLTQLLFPLYLHM